MTANSIRGAACAVLAGTAMLTAGCGKYVRDQGTSPSQVVILSMQAAQGNQPTKFGIPLNSDVLTKGSVYDDIGQVTMELVLKDPGQAGTTATPSSLNQVTFDRFHVEFVRSDGRNVQGVDVPYAFDASTTFTVPNTGTVAQPFELVRHVSKSEAPLAALTSTGAIISTVANVTFYGHDLAGNQVNVTGTIQVNFGDFADPTS